MRITDLLTTALVYPAMDTPDKEQAIRRMCEAASGAAGTEMGERIYRSVMDRERIMSTGVGKGLGIPHGKVSGLEGNIIVYARLVRPIDFGSIDGMPVNMIFLVVGPEAESGTHIRLLSRISRLMNNDAFRDRLAACPDAPSIIRLCEEEERLHP